MKKIVVVDDDPDILDSITMMLEYDGYEVIPFQNGKNLVGLASFLPDLIVMDVWLPGTDGRVLCMQLKKTVETQKIPVVMISASRDVKESALQSGADDFLAKPFDMDELLDTVRKNLS